MTQATCARCKLGASGAEADILATGWIKTDDCPPRYLCPACSGVGSIDFPEEKKDD